MSDIRDRDLAKARKHALKVIQALGVATNTEEVRQEFKAMMKFQRYGDEHPFFTEATLYDLLGKDDARSVLAYIHSLAEAAGIPRWPDQRDLKREAYKELER